MKRHKAIWICLTLVAISCGGCGGGTKDFDFHYEIALEWHAKGQRDQAINSLTEALKLNPNHVEARYLRGFNLQESGQYDEALKDFDQVIKSQPEHALAYCYRSNVWLNKGDFDKTVADATQAIKLSSDCADAYFFRGEAFYKNREYDKAMVDMREFIRQKPASQTTDAYASLGRIFAAKGEDIEAIDHFGRAIREYDELIASNTKHLVTTTSQGEVWYGLENYLKGALAYKGRADVFKRRGEYDKALADYTKALRLDANDQALNAILSVERGKIFIRMGQFLDAREAFKRAIDTDDQCAEAYANLAWLFSTCSAEKYRDAQAAIGNAQQACELTGWNQWQSLETLAAAYAEAGDFDKATKWQSKAVELAPEEEQSDLRARLDLYRTGRPFRYRS